MKSLLAGLMLALLALITVACAPVILTASHRIVFQPEIYDDLTGEFVFSLTVRNDHQGELS